MALTFEPVNLWCYHSNETSSAALSHGFIDFVCTVLTFESVGEIVRRGHENETSLAVLLRGVISLSDFYNMKFGSFVKLSPWPLLVVKWVKRKHNSSFRQMRMDIILHLSNDGLNVHLFLRLNHCKLEVTYN